MPTGNWNQIALAKTGSGVQTGDASDRFGQVEALVGDLKQGEGAASGILAQIADTPENLAVLLSGTDCIKGAFAIADHETGSFVFCNAHARALFASILEEGETATVESFLHAAALSNRAMTVGDLRDALLPATPQTGTSDTVELTLHDAPYELRSSQIRIEGSGWFTCFSLFDISMRKSLLAAQSDLISVVSHELRSPLASIRGSLQLLNSGALGELPEEARKVFEIAMRNSEHMLSVVNEILEDESQKRKNELKTEFVDLASLVRDAIDGQSGFAAQWGVMLLETNLPHKAFALGNRQKLLQVMNNLISNAIKFSPKNSQIRISIVERPDRWRIEITDQGPGVPKEQRPVLFSRFATTKVLTEQKLASSGLGLSIAKDIVETHGGLIDFRDETPNGTTFFFDLNKAPADPGVMGSTEGTYA